MGNLLYIQVITEKYIGGASINFTSIDPEASKTGLIETTDIEKFVQITSQSVMFFALSISIETAETGIDTRRNNADKIKPRNVFMFTWLLVCATLYGFRFPKNIGIQI